MKYRKILNSASVLFTIGFIAGLIHAIFFVIIPNNYFQNGLYRLLTLDLQKYLNQWIFTSLISLFIILPSVLIFKFLWKIIQSKIIEITIKDNTYFRYFLFVLILIGLFSGFGLWAINEYIVPSYRAINLNWLFFLGILLLTCLMVFFLFQVRYTNKIAIILFLLVLMLNVGSFFYGNIHKPNVPNVILISIDTLRADHLGCYGYHRNTSPNIDIFAKNNLILKNNYVQDNWTLTSHMSIMTSLYPPKHGVNKKKRLPSSITTLAEVLKNTGYKTLGFAGDCVWMQAKYGFSQGFDIYDVKNYNPSQPELNAEFENRYISKYLKKFKNNPIFLFIHYFDVHSDFNLLPYDSPNQFRNLYNKNYTGDFIGGFGDILASKYLMYLNSSQNELKQEDLEYIISLYDGGISYVDKCIGDLFEILKNQDLYEDSLIILTSDHGEEFKEHGRMLHTQIYDEIMKVPMIVKMPKGKAINAVIEGITESIDIMPFIINFLKIKKKPDMQGKSFLDLLNNSTESDFKEYIYAFNESGQAFIRNTKWKLLTDNIMNENGYKLYNLLEDVNESNDVKYIYENETKNLKNKLFMMYKGLKSDSIERKISLTQQEEEKLKSIGYLK